MSEYNQRALIEAQAWAAQMKKKPNWFDKSSKGIQRKFNSMIPEKVHEVITEAMKQTTQAVMTGSGWTSGKPVKGSSLQDREQLVDETIEFYKRSATVSGAGTGAGGLLLGLADFPILLTLKFKMLFEIMLQYGYDVSDPKERLFILYVFQTAFSSPESRRAIVPAIEEWEDFVGGLTIDLDQTNWRTWQQEYRDYIDLAKLFQLVPGIGMVVGAVANNQLVDQLGKAAKNACRLRYLKTTL